MTQDICDKIEYLTRGTTETAPVGALADNISLPANLLDEEEFGPDKTPKPKISKYNFKSGLRFILLFRPTGCLG